MRVLVTWGSKLGGTAGIARIIADELIGQGFEVEAHPATVRLSPAGFQAVVIGGALYANRWHASARRFVRRNAAQLRQMPVWFFSSGPLDDSAERREIPPPPKVEALMQLVGAQGHKTFGGRLEPDARGFPAAAMAKKMSGDWRNMEQIRGWAGNIAMHLPSARPNPSLEPAGRAPHRALAYALAGWALTSVLVAWLFAGSGSLGTVMHAILAPIVFAAVGYGYFRLPGAREPLATASAFTGIVFLLDLIVVHRSFEFLASFAGGWLPLLLVFASTWLTGALMSTLPWPTEAPNQAKA